MPATLAIAAGLMILLSGLAFAGWTVTDLDNDGLTVRSEWDRGTDPVLDDTDMDGVRDGWETARGLDPLSPDTDLDSVPDRAELDNRTDPLSADTDRDLLSDAEESVLVDCNGNGVSSAREDDDDSDRRRDSREPTAHRCDPDVDGDGILDGNERNPNCIVNADCDTDGLDDPYEHNSSFDPLNPDTFGVGLEDAILDAFQRRGQTPSGDVDDDGIPDGWENNNGLIEWGTFTPTTGTRDLLIEYVRVNGPDSGRFPTLSLVPAYDQVRDLFQREGNIRVQSVETVIQLPNEQLPTLIPSSYSAYYQNLLNLSQYAANPYVTTVVMNPQHDQSEVLHAGVAPIRGMLAAVDYGLYVSLRYTLGSQSISLSPLVESAIEGNRLDVIQSLRWEQAGRTVHGEMFLDGGNYKLYWRPYWFRTPPRAVFDSGSVAQLTFDSFSVDHDGMARTIAHELGHTLGLCHLELPDCQRNITLEDRANLGTSVMFPGAPSLHLLPSEWTHVARYLTCPAHGPLELIAQNRSRADIIEEKYGYTLSEIRNVGLRECGDFGALMHTIAPELASFVYEPPPQNLSPPAPFRTATYSIAYLAVAILAVAAGAIGGAMLHHRRATR